MTGVSMGEIAYNDLFKPPVVTDTVTITTQPQDVDCYVGGSATLSIVAESDDETAILSYQWQVYGEDWTDITDATSTSYSASTAAIGDTNYRCNVTSDKGGSATSETAEVSVSAQPLPPVDHITITTQPTASTSVYVSQTATLSVVAESDDPDATLYYQWQVYDGEEWDDIVGASSSTYTAPTSTVGVNTYRVLIASSLSGTATSDSATVTVSVDTVLIITNPGDTQVYLNEGASVACEASSNAQGATLSYQWQIYNAFDEDYEDISGATSATYTGIDTSSTGNQTLRCVVTSSYGGTATTTAATVTVAQRDTITITTQPTTTSGYVGDTITLSVTAVSDNPSATLSYQWQVKNGATYDDISGATSSTYTVPTSTAGTERYRVIVTSDKGGTATSNYADVTLSYQPVILYNHYTSPGYLSTGYDSTEGSITKATDIFDAGVYYFIPTTNGYHLAKEDNGTLVYMYNDTTLGIGNGVNFTSDISNADVLILGTRNNRTTITKYSENKYFGWSDSGSGYRYYSSNEGGQYEFTITPYVAPTVLYESDFSEAADGWTPRGATNSLSWVDDGGGSGHIYVSNNTASWNGAFIPSIVAPSIPTDTPIKFTWWITGTGTTYGLGIYPQSMHSITVASNLTKGQWASATTTIPDGEIPSQVYIDVGQDCADFSVYGFKIEYIPTTST